MRKIKQIIKNQKVIYKGIFNLYSMLVLLCIKIMQLLIKIKPNHVILNSFYGRSYNDSPRVIFEEMLKDKYFKNFIFYWVVDENIELPDDSRIKIIKGNTFSYLVALLRSKVWITNSDINRFKSTIVPKKNHFYINTWHGIPLKKLGPDEDMIEWRIGEWYRKVEFDLLCANSEYDYNILEHIFPSSKNNIIDIGLPRNDELINNDISTGDIKNKLDIQKNKKVILYAPTYRDYNRVSENKTVENLSIFSNLSVEEIAALKKDYIFLIRGHYLSSVIVDDTFDSIFIDVTTYPNINELMRVSDMLITDYSSVMFDYSLLEKPVYLLTTDLEEYSLKRGMYQSIDSLEIPHYMSMSELLDDLLNDKYKLENIIKMKYKYFNNTEGNAGSLIVQRIKEHTHI